MQNSKVLDHTSFKPLTDDVVVRPSPYAHLSDEEVVSQCILSERPVTSEKNIWGYWASGWASMPAWRQRTVIDWVRRHGTEWEVRVLDSVRDSPWHLARWTSSKWYAECMLNDTLTHKHAPQHISDAVRLATVIEHGGAFLDPGLLMFCDVDQICWNRISDPNDPTEIYNNLWERYTSSKGMSSDPLLKDFPHPGINQDIRDMMGDVNYSELLDYGTHGLCNSRLCHIEDPNYIDKYGGHGFSAARYWRDHVRLMPAADLFGPHSWSIGELGTLDPEMYSRLQLPFEPDSGDERQAATRRQFGTALASRMSWKLAGGPMKIPSLALMWNKDSLAGHTDVDQIPGSWSEYLRWARIHLVQQRDVHLLTSGTPELPGPKIVYRVGLLEVVGPNTETYELPPPSELSMESGNAGENGGKIVEDKKVPEELTIHVSEVDAVDTVTKA